MLGLMAHYGSAYLANPRANEMGIGLTMGFACGIPAWLGLPVYVVTQWKRSPAWEKLLLALPAIAGPALFFGIAATR